MTYVYFGKSHRFSDINDDRIVSFFGSPDPKLRETVLSRNGLLEHVKQSAYQAGWLWRECLLNIILPIPALWGWKPNSENVDTFSPQWQQSASETTIEEVLTTCGCKTDSCKNCKCGILGEKCLAFCKCQRKCKNL